MRHPLCRILKRTRGQVSVPLLLGDLLSHDAKIPSNNLAWKDIGFYARCGRRIKKEWEVCRECRWESVNLGNRKDEGNENTKQFAWEIQESHKSGLCDYRHRIASHCCRIFTLCKTAQLNIDHCQHPTSWLINVSGKRLWKYYCPLNMFLCRIIRFFAKDKSPLKR